MAKDPVCGKEVDEAAVRSGESSEATQGISVVDPQQGTRRFHDGRWYYFCGLQCRTDFMATPEKYEQPG